MGAGAAQDVIQPRKYKDLRLNVFFVRGESGKEALPSIENTSEPFCSADSFSRVREFLSALLFCQP